VEEEVLCNRHGFTRFAGFAEILGDVQVIVTQLGYFSSLILRMSEDSPKVCKEVLLSYGVAYVGK
jgi:hypothetical protein